MSHFRVSSFPKRGVDLSGGPVTSGELLDLLVCSRNPQ